MTAASASAAGPPILFDALLTPHRSLGRHGFRILMSVVCASFFVIGLGFFLVGAWPVVGFMGAEVLLLFIAFKINYRRARMFESLELTRQSFTVRRVDARGAERCWRFQPYWLKVEMDDPSRPDAQLRLYSHGRALIIGSFLNVDERRELAAEIRRQLDLLRHAPLTPPAPSRGPD
jgi:uncharacterized membrane protein